MWTTSLLTGLALFTLGAHAAWPIQDNDFTEGGNCNPETEQYLQVEAYDFHDHPKLTMRWRQITGACGESVDDSELVSWEVSYDGSEGGEDDPPTTGDGGRVQLNLFVCCPFGNYEIDLDVDSYSDEGSTLQQRTAWEIENGYDEHHIWDTVNTYLADDPAYSPTSPGTYSWPLDGETGYYSTIYAGPLPPTECPGSVPAGVVYKDCYKDSASARVFKSKPVLVKPEMGKKGMTIDACSEYCLDDEYFAVEFSNECFCGTEAEFKKAIALSPEDSGYCGSDYDYLCTGDATTACGGRNAMSVYMRTKETPPPTPAPVSTPTVSFSSVGCYADPDKSRIMSRMGSEDNMTAQVCSELCNDDSKNSHFGTQYGRECWCGSPVLSTRPLSSDSCDFECSGDADEKCGGYYKMSVYEYANELVYEGCYRDSKSNRVMGDKRTNPDSMTNEYCQVHCQVIGTEYFGTQYGKECWCGDRLGGSKIGENECSYTCTGDYSQTCGGYNALSVYAVA